ncbi:hypothetical protein [Burkholderia sp. NRF60-BP8]|uniref:hypothetical protein n=1 Tax=Burkholderia sp. NRF60-BP8 TaxID=1637853 RepID=UPI00075357E3|nr:hypothetical protein [Burkholderia sp. NRF60-BP8]AOI76057.1 hypothetical protein WS54_07085 [Burkholderia sp. NRF60-BP8]KVA07137.1 hypothetical protein WS54_23520 [Burkholderia sp. NRF60-BP8]
MNRGYDGVQLEMPNEREHRRQIAQLANNLLQGKMNTVIQVTLTPSATTTTVTDKRIGGYTGLFFSPLTANAAAALSGLYVSAQHNGSATLTHASTASVDRTFNVLLVG